MDRFASFYRKPGILAFLFVAACPIIFLLSVINLSKITVPFWDHFEQAEFISRYYEAGLWPAVYHIFATVDQHSRPVTVRLIFLFNGILTRWDISSEYKYVYLVICLSLLLHFRIIRRLAQTPKLSTAEAMLCSAVAIIYCSPANHNNHWWSWMLQLNLDNLLNVAALFLIAYYPRSWKTNAAAAALCWLSIYTLTNGLFLILAVAFIVQLASERPLVPDKLTAFWLVNIVASYWSYFPIAEPGMSARPRILDIFHFVVMYVGEPVAALIRFPYQNMFEPPPGLWLSTISGAFLIVIAMMILVFYRHYFRNPPAHFLLFLGFLIFALLSAAVTGWARVTFDSYGLRNGNSSRYVITGSLFVIGILYLAFAERKTFLRTISFGFSGRLTSDTRYAVLAGSYVLFLLLSVNAYAHSVRIYKEVRNFNKHIAAGFAFDASDTPVDGNLYPNEERLRTLRKELLRYRLGPYRSIPARS